jgi:hypothetical protein
MHGKNHKTSSFRSVFFYALKKEGRQYDIAKNKVLRRGRRGK